MTMSPKKKEKPKKEAPPPTIEAKTSNNFPPDAEVIERVKTRLAKIFGPEIPVEEAKLTVTFKDGSEKSYNVLP